MDLHQSTHTALPESDGPVDGQFDDADEEIAMTPQQQGGREDAGDMRFNPPLYRQRYLWVAQVLEDNNVKSVADLGCAECKVLPIYKAVPCLEDIVGVDIDKPTVSSGIYFSKPLMADHLMKRPRPLRVRLFCGSAAEYDSRLGGVEAVTLIEVIEHLYPDILSAVATNIFSRLRPRLVVMTTPNVEYNVLFPGDRTGFRHWDHKFEWTRRQFEDWCGLLARCHGYTVEYSGVGAPPPDQAHVGFCSQTAVFLREGGDREACERQEVKLDDSQPYELIADCDHPHESPRPIAESVANETRYYLFLITNDIVNQSDEALTERIKDLYSYDESTNTLTVGLQYLLNFKHFEKFQLDLDAFRDILEKENFTLSDDKTHIVHQIQEEPDDDEEDEEYNTQPEDVLPSDTNCDQDNSDVRLSKMFSENWDDT